ncbi:amidase [Kitasatospora sp. NA04385]|uniref:amidase n=1 Tax=Kitasatospora sp. NA04385 TaxID=2742135 RepID=UPI00158FA272|nr:amidase [Kitasatospora sp. NA04385]QKW20578.1 amidase [Kitasatospora sp. NA04385]
MDHHFTLGLDDHEGRGVSQSSPLHALMTSPPAGCVPLADGPFFLECHREAESLLEGVADVAGEVRARYGLVLNDLGVVKLQEWSEDGLNGFGAETVAQHLLLAIYRAGLLGYTAEDLVRFIRTVAVGSSSPDPEGAEGHQSSGLPS